MNYIKSLDKIIQFALAMIGSAVVAIFLFFYCRPYFSNIKDCESCFIFFSILIGAVFCMKKNEYMPLGFGIIVGGGLGSYFIGGLISSFH